MKKETLNYNLLTRISDKFAYIAIMNIVSVGIAVGIIWLFFKIKNIIEFLNFTNYAEIYLSIYIIAFCLFILTLILGANIFRATLCLLLWIIFIHLYPLLIYFFDFGFEWGWFLIGFGWVLMIFPSIVLVFCKINVRLFIWNLIIINLITFGINILTYGSWHK